MNLVSIVGDRIKKHVLALGHSEKEWRILVIDQTTARLLHYALPMSEVLSRNIAMVERIEEARSPSKEFGVIYFVSPTSQNVKRIEKDTAQKMYRTAYVVSVAEIQARENKTLDALCKSAEKGRAKAKESSKDHVLFEFHYKTVIFDFVPLTSDIFRVETSASYYADKDRHIEELAEKLKSVCRTIKVHCMPVSVGMYAKKLAALLDGSGNGRAVILERGSDVNTPLIHTFTFESLLWDLGLAGPGYLVEHQKPKKSAEKDDSSAEESEDADEKRMEVTEEHKVWESIRNRQLVEAHRALTEIIKKETSDEKSEKSNINKLVKAVQSLPAQTRRLKEIKVLMGLLEKCVGFFNSPGIKEAAELEQGISTGKDFKGNNFKHAVTKSLFNVLETASLTHKEKCRLYILYVLNYGSLQKNEEKRIVERGYLSRADIESAEAVKTHLAGRQIKPLTKRPLPIARHTPLVADVLDAIINKNETACRKLEIDLPAAHDVLTGGSLRKREFIFKKSTSSDAVHRRIIIVYFIGGVSIAEISEMREIAKNTGITILIGSTDICSPGAFLDTLKGLK
ncbi:syntaxin-binding protein 3 [Nematocida major]|uniref:syntaxin-binding protein 3 n=1 Tax=Nematocida major TaxID=1912982 RepID=UPI002008C8A0|nr:syntaxin-binding protein 3 [Nematocida major]KAH9385997.1 syntaxin-binding protein 3 [Nematocida major]